MVILDTHPHPPPTLMRMAVLENYFYWVLQSTSIYVVMLYFNLSCVKYSKINDRLHFLYFNIEYNSLNYIRVKCWNNLSKLMKLKNVGYMFHSGPRKCWMELCLTNRIWMTRHWASRSNEEWHLDLEPGMITFPIRLIVGSELSLHPIVI